MNLEQVVQQIQSALDAGPTDANWRAKHVSGSNFAVQEFDIRADFGTKPGVSPIFNKSTEAIDGTTVCCSPGDAALIAACNPQSIRILLDALEEAQRDARRYRWLCKDFIVPRPSLWDQGVGFTCDLPTPTRIGRMSKFDLDAAIDKAMEQPK